jgi:dienelactone hydrolase
MRSTLVISLVALGAVAATVLAASLGRPIVAKDDAPAGTTIEYKDGDVVCEGYLAKPAGVAGKRPGVLVVHEWMGLGDFAKGKADALAALGYVAFAADVYGKGVRPKDTKEAGAQAGKWKGDRPAFRKRVRAALDAMLADPNVDASHVAAIGFCFGGTGVLELGRSGAPVHGIVTFHGGLDSPTSDDGKNVRGKVLVLHGADDTNVPPPQVAAFVDEMRKGKVDWQMVQYGNAVHSFTNPAAGNDNAKGAAYNEAADRRSWQAMKDFFAEVLGPTSR